eukprot:7728889-Karenia_brevis.AAC.1
MTFTVHEKVVDMLIESYMRTPPPGYAKISIDQVQRADKEIFRRLMEVTRAGIVVNAAGDLPCDLALPGILFEPGVQILLLPLPEKGGSDTGKRGPADTAAQGEPP